MSFLKVLQNRIEAYRSFLMKVSDRDCEQKLLQFLCSYLLSEPIFCLTMLTLCRRGLLLEESKPLAAPGEI